jgi:hypothetical protein
MWMLEHEYMYLVLKYANKWINLDYELMWIISGHSCCDLWKKKSHDTNAFTEINPQNLNKIKKEKLMLKRRPPEYLLETI